jgi:hypothetical protein
VRSCGPKERSDRIQSLARETVSLVRIFVFPQGLQVEKGPDAVVEYIEEQLPPLIEQ